MRSLVKDKTHALLCIGDDGDGNKGDIALVSKLEITIGKNKLDYFQWLNKATDEQRKAVAVNPPPPNLDVLKKSLAELERMRAAALWLNRRPWLGHDVFARGAPESLRVEDRSGLHADLPSLLQSYVAARRRALARRPYRPKPRKLFSVQEALERLTRLVGALPSWSVLQGFLPDTILDPLERRAALASTLVAGLEMARGGGIEIRQEEAFGPILVRRRTEEGAADDQPG